MTTVGSPNGSAKKFCVPTAAGGVFGQNTAYEHQFPDRDREPT
jgi:hypothetical protein